VNASLFSGLSQPLGIAVTTPEMYDFNQDGKPDLLLSNASTQKTAIWYMNNNALINGVFGPTIPAGWSLVAP
jgi:hypothetical protein